MDTSFAPSDPPWHRRVLDWLGLEQDEPQPQRLPDPLERFPWEPGLPPPRPPQWGAADRPEMLLGADGSWAPPPLQGLDPDVRMPGGTAE